MTARTNLPMPAGPEPDGLEAIVAAHPRRLTLTEATQPPGELVLSFSDPEMRLRGFVRGDRRVLARFAREYEALRADAVPRCQCGLLYAAHDWDAAGKRKGACRDGPGTYRAAPLAASGAA